MFPIFIKGKELSFTTSLSLNGENFTDLSIDDMTTEYGFFIHLSRSSFAILDFLRNPDDDAHYTSPIENASALLITSTGQLLLLRMAKKVIGARTHFLEKIPLPVSDNVKTAFSILDTIQDRALLAMEMSEELPIIIDFFMKTSPVLNVKYFTLNIADTIEFLKENKPSKTLTREYPGKIFPIEVSKEFD